MDFIVKASGRQRRATICRGDEEVAEIKLLKDLTYVLAAKDGGEWALSTRVNGEIKPFSMAVRQLKVRNAHDSASGATTLTIRDHLFLHNGRFYVLGGTPEGRPPKEFLLGKSYICRLDGLPFSELNDVDHETKSRLTSRFRGAPVGEVEGLGKEGHHVRLSGELEDIGLPLAASCYLLYSTA